MRVLPTTNIALLVLAFLHVPPAVSADQSLSYSYFELRGDISTTANDARGARDDANGRLVGLTANWEFRESWYAKAGYSLERKSFSNEVAGNVLSLDTRQAAATLGGGRFWHAGEKTDIYVEALVVHVRTDHDVPDVAVMQGGPPTVGTRVSVIEDTGFGAAVGARHAFGEATEVEGRMEIQDVAGQTATMLSATGRRQLTEHVSIGLFASLGKSTNRHIGDVATIGTTLRYAF